MPYEDHSSENKSSVLTYAIIESIMSVYRDSLLVKSPGEVSKDDLRLRSPSHLTGNQYEETNRRAPHLL